MKIDIKDLDKWINTDSKFEKFKVKTKSTHQSPIDLEKDKKTKIKK